MCCILRTAAHCSYSNYYSKIEQVDKVRVEGLTEIPVKVADISFQCRQKRQCDFVQQHSKVM